VVVIGLERKQREAVGVVERAALARDQEEDDGAGHEDEADEHLQDQDIHELLLIARRTRKVVARTVDTELSGMSTAHQSGVMRPATASETVSTL
jgi:hypothetical protein